MQKGGDHASLGHHKRRLMCRHPNCRMPARLCKTPRACCRRCRNTSVGVRGFVNRDAENDQGGNLPEDVAAAKGQRAGRRDVIWDELLRAFREQRDQCSGSERRYGGASLATTLPRLQTPIYYLPRRGSPRGPRPTRCIQGTGWRFLLHLGTDVRRASNMSALNKGCDAEPLCGDASGALHVVADSTRPHNVSHGGAVLAEECPAQSCGDLVSL
jgi:hypothetical protein